MITEFILTAILNANAFIINLLPDMPTFNLPTNEITDFFVQITYNVSYFLPMGHLVTIFTLSLVILNFHILWSLIHTIWKMLPFT